MTGVSSGRRNVRRKIHRVLLTEKKKGVSRNRERKRKNTDLCPPFCQMKPYLAPFHPSISYASIMESCWRITLSWLAILFLARTYCVG